MIEELFTLSYDHDKKDYILKMNTDLVKKFYTNKKDITENLDYELINKLKSNLIQALRKGDKLQKLTEELVEEEYNELNISKKPTNQSFSSHDCCSIGRCPNPNCNRFVDGYNRKCDCG